MSEKPIERIVSALGSVETAQRKLLSELEAAYPPGTWVSFPWGNTGRMRGTVEKWSDWLRYPRVTLRLDSSGKTFAVDAFHLYREALEL